MGLLSVRRPRRITFGGYAMRVLAGAVLALLVGCAGQGETTGSRTVTHREFTDEGRVRTETVDQQTATQTLPPNVSEAGAFSIGPKGITIGGISTWEVDQVMAGAGWFYIGAIALIVAAAWSGYRKNFVLALCLGAAALVCMFAPTLIDRLGGFIAVIVGLLIVAGVVYAVGKWVMGWDFKARGQAAYEKLMSEAEKLRAEGKAAEAEARRREAVAALRVADPAQDEAIAQAKRAERGLA